MKLIKITLNGFCLVLSLFANGQIKYPSLKVGDTVPNIVFRHMSNYLADSAKITDFRGKLLILDFWNIHCVPCIGGMPKMEKLQQQFGDKIQILLVNGTNPLEALGGKMGFPRQSSNSIIRRTSLPFVFQTLTQEETAEYRFGKEDKGILTSLFQHAGEPYHAWIDQHGVVVALTKGTNTHEQSIRDFLAEGKTDLETVNLPTAFHYEKNASFLQPPNELVLSKILYSSVITKNLFTKYGKGSGWIRDTITNRIVGFRKMNDTPARLFTFAYDFITENKYGDRLVFEDEHQQSSFIPAYPIMTSAEKVEWQANNIYSYELMLPPSRITTSNEANQAMILKIMRQDLENYFGIRGSIELINRKCLVLVRINKQIQLGTKGGANVVEALPGDFKIINTSFEAVVSRFVLSVNALRSGTPIIDETGLDNTPVDLTIHADFSNVAAVRKELNRYGIDVREEEREFKILVLKASNDMPVKVETGNAIHKNNSK